MTQEAIMLSAELEKFKNKSKGSKVLKLVLVCAAVVSPILCILGTTVNQSKLVTIGIFLFLVSIMGLFLPWFLSYYNYVGGIQRMLKTMEKTGSIKYVNEILDNKYKYNGKECISDHLYYIPGKFILAFSDILDIRLTVQGSYRSYTFVSIDSKQFIVPENKINKETVTYLLNNYPITSNASYSEMKPKFDAFKKGAKK